MHLYFKSVCSCRRLRVVWCVACCGFSAFSWEAYWILLWLPLIGCESLASRRSRPMSPTDVFRQAWPLRCGWNSLCVAGSSLKSRTESIKKKKLTRTPRESCIASAHVLLICSVLEESYKSLTLWVHSGFSLDFSQINFTASGLHKHTKIFLKREDIPFS